MDPAQWEHIKALFASALEREPGQRNAFLQQACGDDPNLLAEVESLIKSYHSTNVHPFVETAATTAVPLSTRLGSYRVICEIGHGGMATVYLAARADEQYHKRVAIKVLNQALTTDEMVRRFRNERQTLAALDHPNIVKLLDGGSTDQGLPYLVMDYVEGLPITDYCDNHRLSTTERLHLFRSVCAAVHYAHKNLIIHRDLKPDNILVTTDGTPKVLDFGIAKLVNPAFSRETVLTRTNVHPMTPEYASPEQVRGESVTVASDVYSLGVILYELLTGHRPYRLKRQSAGEIERVICEQDPEKPSTAVTHSETEVDPEGTTVTVTPEMASRIREGRPEELSRRLHGDLDTIILKTLRKEPQRRYASAEELAEDIRRHLEGLPVMARRPTVGYRCSKFAYRHRREGLVAVLGLAMLVGSFVLDRWQSRRGALSRTKLRRSVAVLGFKNLSGRPETNWLSTALSEMLGTELAAGEKLRTIPGENVAQMKINLSLPDTDSLAPNTLTRVRKNLGTDFVVLGSYLDLGKDSGGQIRLDLRLQDATAGETVAAVSEIGNEAQVFDLVARAGTELRQHLGIGEVTLAQAAAVRATLPTNSEAARQYAEGISKLRLFDALGSRDLLENVVAVDPNNVMAHSALADAWMRLGYDERAKEEAKKAFDFSTSVSSEERLLVEARYRQAVNQWSQAADIYRRLFAQFPDNVDYGLLLAEAQGRVGKQNESLATVRLLRNLPPPAGDDPRIDEREAYACNATGDYRCALAVAERGEARTRAVGARLLLARIQQTECSALHGFGQLDRAKSACDAARDVYASVGDKNGEAQTLRLVAGVYRDQADLAGAEKLYLLAADLAREIGDQKGTASALEGLATNLYFVGDYKRAEETYNAALIIYKQIADAESENRIQDALGSIYVTEGKLALSRATFEKTLATYQKFGDRDNEALDWSNLGFILFLLGDLNAAQRDNDKSVALANAMGDKIYQAYAMANQGDLLVARGDLENGKRRYQDAAAIEKQVGQMNVAATNQLAVAEVLIEQGRPPEAEPLLGEAVQQFRKQRMLDYQLLTSAALARMLMIENKLPEAVKEIESAKPIRANAQMTLACFIFDITSGRVLAANGRLIGARTLLNDVLIAAKRKSFFGIELDARLALGEIEMKSGQAATGRARLARLEKEARAKGFGLIARKAATARG